MSQVGNGRKSKPRQRQEYQVVLSMARKLKIYRFRESNSSNVGSSEWIENLLQFMQDPKIQINDIHRWVTNHKWTVAPVVSQMQSHEQSTPNAFLLPTQHQNPHDNSRNIQNEHFMDGSNSILNAGGNNGIFQNVPEHGYSFGVCHNAPSCSTSTSTCGGGSQSQQHFSPIIIGSSGNTQPQTPPVLERMETPSKRPKNRKKEKKVSNCDILCNLLRSGEDLSKMRQLENHSDLLKEWESHSLNVFNSVQSSILKPKVIKYETVTLEEDENENENENERVEVENDKAEDMQDKDPLQNYQ